MSPYVKIEFMKIKICGLTRPCEAEYLNKYHADFAGMVLFFPKSKRNITIEQSYKIRRLLNPDIRSVAVTVSPTADQIEAIVSAGFDYIQIHGSMPQNFSEYFNIPVLKAFNVSDIGNYTTYEKDPAVAGFVFDASEPGSGKAFNWDILNNIPRDGRPFILAGGLDPRNVSSAIAAVHPDAVDVSSGVEYDDMPGKDPDKIRAFISAVKASS